MPNDGYRIRNAREFKGLFVLNLKEAHLAFCFVFRDPFAEHL